MVTNVVQQRQMNVNSIITSYSAAANGYIQLGPILEQWGQIQKQASAVNAAVTFPIAFPNVVWTIELTTSANSTLPGFGQAVTSSKTTGCNVTGLSFGSSPPDATITIYWVAKGN